MILSHIVAVSSNFVIGKNNRLPWKMPDDAKYFHRVTEGHIVIMGRKNYLANGKALKNRTNIVITRNPDFKPDDAIVCGSIAESLNVAERYSPDEVFIVGGGEIYKQTLDIIDRIYITIIDMVAEGDTFYPEINISDYRLISEIRKLADRINPYDHTYYILERPGKT